MAAPNPPPMHRDSPLAWARVLVVDDNPINRQVAVALLGAWGIAPAVAEDGAQAVALACESPFDLILMDLRMPVLDGLRATAQIRRFEADRQRVRVPVVAFTSEAAGSQPTWAAAGIDGALVKPCDAEALHACLLQWCGHRPRMSPDG